MPGRWYAESARQGGVSVVVRSWTRRLRQAARRYRASRRVNADVPKWDHVLSRITAYRARAMPGLRAAPDRLREVTTRWAPAIDRLMPASWQKPPPSDIHEDDPPREEVPAPVASPAPEEPGEPAGNEEPKAGSKESKRWELIIAASIAWVAMTGAVLTYLAIQKESAAVESDRESVVQTVMVQNQNVAAKIQVDANGTLAARYRQLMAEASVLSSIDEDQAILSRLNAAGFIATAAVSDYLTGTGATARYDDSAALQGVLAADATSANLPADEPALTAKRAAHDYVISRRIRISIVGLLGVVVILTVARLAKARKLRRGLYVTATLGYAAATVAAIIEVV
jgi:hypothetical protein